MKFKTKFLICNPQRADVIIFDECNNFFLRQAISDKYSVNVFNMRPPEVFINFSIIKRFLLVMLRGSYREVSNDKRGFLVGFLRLLRRMYFQSCLMEMRPKAVITLIDNSTTFSWLAKNCRNVAFIGIQNGMRLSYANVEGEDVYHQHLFCFGTHEVGLLPSLGWRVDNFYPVGSLVASLHFKKNAEKVECQYDLLVISTWRGNIGYEKDVADTMRSMKIMDCLLAEYISNKNLRAAVVLRSERDSEDWYMPEVGMSEEEYFKSIYSKNVKIIDNNFSERPVYSAMQEAELIVSCLSTALMEAVGIEKKICYFNFTDTDLYHRDIDEKLVFTNPEKSAFFCKLDQLLSMPEKDFLKINFSLKKLYMNNTDIPSYIRIMNQIDSIIESKNI